MDNNFYKEAFLNRNKYIDQLEKENLELGLKNEFLMKRENKLQLIEQLFKKQPVDFDKMIEIINENEDDINE